MIVMCYFCGEKIISSVYRNSTCPNCGKELKICFNCEFYSPGSQWDCRESISEPVREKDRANFCDFFSLNSERKGEVEDMSKKEKARSQFKNLFNDD